MEMAGWWWSRPNFVAAQKDESFQAWVTMIELGFDLCEFDDLVPELEGDYYRDDALLVAEKHFLRLFPDRATVKAKENTHTYLLFVGLIGHMYVHHLECKWVNQVKDAEYSITEVGPAIEQPWNNRMLLSVIASPRVAAIRHEGNLWDFTFRNNRKNYLEWVEQGRPEPK
ncbi:hypothetical protein ACQ7HM_05110 [Williamsia sp. MIQD14]|uniref:hypothetical protein n=1 Tax=Williamsia sp. MIQD14 TaxID=3425703 RepID=UPI003DA036CF